MGRERVHVESSLTALIEARGILGSARSVCTSVISCLEVCCDQRRERGQRSDDEPNDMDRESNSGLQGGNRVPLIVPVLMSGRSGSSVIAHAVQMLGVDLGNRLRAPRAKNPKGFFEDQDVRRLSKRLHRVLGGRARMSLVPADRWDEPAVKALEDDAVAILARRFADVPAWGFKNGRTLRYLPFWQRVLDRLDGEARYVFAIRNPLAAAVSRDLTRADKLMDRGGGVELNLYQWLTEVVPHFGLLREQPLLVVDFDRLAAAPAEELRRIAEFLGFPWTDARAAAAARFAERFLAEGLRHHRYDLDDLERDPRVPVLARESYRLLDALAIDDGAAGDTALWQHWSRLDAQLEELAPLLNFAGATEQALWRAQLNPLTPLSIIGRKWWPRSRSSGD